MRKPIFFFAFSLALSCGGSSSTTPGADASTGDDASTHDGGTIDAPSCAAPLTSCGAACVDTTTDAKNCGTCGHACATGTSCKKSACVFDTGTAVVLAIKKFYLGDTDRMGVASQTAWKKYGMNLDGKTTDRLSTDVCTLATGAPKAAQTDGDNGIDNSFGENILPIWLSVIGPTFSQKVNDAIAAGTAETIVFRIDGVTAQPDAAMAPGGVYVGAPLGSAAKWDGSDVWPIDSSSVNGGDLTKPSLAYANGSMTNRVWTAAPPAVAANLPMLFLADEQVLISDVKMTMTIAQDGSSAVSGTIAGVMPTDTYIAALKRAAGRISTSLCAGAAFDSIAAQIRQASDILRDGSNMAGVPCDAISIGIGFDATIVKIGNVATPAAPPNPCP